jgi:hypothetical protein
MLDDVNYLGPDPCKPGRGTRQTDRVLEFVRMLAHTPGDACRRRDAHPDQHVSDSEPYQNLQDRDRSSPCSKDGGT